MLRSLFAIVLAVSTTFFTIEPVALAQDVNAASPEQYPQQQQYPQQYPPQQYPPQQQSQQGPVWQEYPQGQQYPPQYPPQNPPGQPSSQGAPDAQDIAADQQHGVGRLSIVQGDVNVKLGSTGELVAAAINAPVMAQDHVQTSAGSRAEVELDYANLIRIAPNTDVGFADLEYHKYQAQLGAGTLIYRVLRQSQAQAEIDTPSIAIRPTRQGEYRVSVLDDGTTQITVRSGQAEMYSPTGSQYLDAGHTTLVRGDPSNPEFQTTYEIARDQFDDWSANRDRGLMASKSYQYVSPDIYGADDLDQYGNWVPSQYGNVWQPQGTASGWSPYSDGNWVWNGYYGWTWVDAAPWGWAPFHYGRWFWNGGHGWCWWPGAVGASYFWNPALVGFFGWGGFGLSFGLGGLGWVALAPFELFHPWWGHGLWGGRGYSGGYDRFGLTRGADIGRMYRNAAIRGGAMTAAYNGFGGPNHRYTAATRGQLTNANLFRGQIPVNATRASSQFSTRQATANPRLASVANRQFFTHQSVAGRSAGFAASRSSGFATRGTAAQQSMHGVPPNLRSNAGAAAGRSYGAQSTAGRTSGGWQRFGDPGTPNGGRQAFAAEDHSGWHRFGEASGSNAAGARSTFAQPSRTPAASTFNRPNAPSSARSFGGNYQSRPLQTPRTSSSFANSGARYSAPHYSTPSTQHYSAPAAPHYSAPHYSAPAAHGGGGSSHGGGGGGSHGGGGHSSSSGHHR